MGLAKNDLRYVTVQFTITDVSTAGQVYIPVNSGMEGDIVEIRTVLNGAIATADVDLTAKITGTAVTGGVVTIAYDGSAAGDVDSVNPTAANVVVEGDVIEIETDGASTNAISAFGTVLIRRF